MFTAAMLLATSAMSIPSFGDNAGEYLWKRGVSYRLRGEEPLMATLVMWVEPNRKISRCWLGRFKGNEDVARSLCPLFLGMRTEFPRDSQGKKTHGLVTVGVFGTYGDIDEDEWKKMRAELDAMPVRGDPDAKLSFIGPTPEPGVSNEIMVGVAADGTATDCAGRGNLPEEVAAEACKIAMAKTYRVRNSMKGEPVPYVRNLSLRSSL
jgi:hypothetical protein